MPKKEIKKINPAEWIRDGFKKVSVIKEQLHEEIKKISSESKPIHEFEGVDMLDNLLSDNQISKDCQRKVYGAYIRLFPYDPQEVVGVEPDYEEPMNVKLDLRLIAREYDLGEDIEHQLYVSIPEKLESELEAKEDLISRCEALRGEKLLYITLMLQLNAGMIEEDKIPETCQWLLNREPRYHLNHLLQTKLIALDLEE